MHSEKPYVCQICDKGFARHATLWNHRRVSNQTVQYIVNTFKIHERLTYEPNILACHSHLEMGAQLEEIDVIDQMNWF